MSRTVCRSDGAIGDVLKAADGLPLARDPLVASALAALLLCFARQPLDQPVLATPRAMSLLGKLLQVLVALHIARAPHIKSLLGKLLVCSLEAVDVCSVHSLRGILPGDSEQVCPVGGCFLTGSASCCFLTGSESCCTRMSLWSDLHMQHVHLCQTLQCLCTSILKCVRAAAGDGTSASGLRRCQQVGGPGRACATHGLRGSAPARVPARPLLPGPGHPDRCAMKCSAASVIGNSHRLQVRRSGEQPDIEVVDADG